MDVSNSVLPGISLLVATLAFGAGCSTAQYSASTSFTVSNDAVAHLVHDAIAGDRDATQMDGSPTVDCTGETSCTISYTVKEPDGGLFDKEDVADLQLVQPTRQVWKGLFADPQFQSGTITVNGPVTTIGGISKTGVYYTLACDRSAASRIDWDNVDGQGIRTLCTYNTDTKGLPGYVGASPGD